MNRFRLSRILRPSLAANEQMTLQARRLIDREIYFQHECNVGFWFFFYHRTASLSNFCIRSSFSMLQLHSGGMHHEQWWVWLQDGGKAIDALMHGITISASVSRKQKEMIVDFRRDGNSQPTCTLDEQLWEWSPALEVPENLNWSYNTSFLVKKTHLCLCFYNIQGAAVYKQSTGIRPGRDYHDFIEQTVSFLIN